MLNKNMLKTNLKQAVAFSQITNYDKPICATCKHFQPKKNFFKDISIEFGKCKSYGKKNVVNGIIDYRYASSVRKDGNACGMEGKDYQYDPSYHWKYTHLYLSPLLVVSPVLLLFLYCRQN
jgi:hypothetical protein